MNNLEYSVHNLQLIPYIKHYFVLNFSSLPQESIELRVPPVGSPVLHFHFGDNTNFYRHKHFTNQSLFIGQYSRHFILYPSRETKLLGVIFKPYGLYNLFGISPNGFRNSAVESSFFFGEENLNRITQTLMTEGIESGITEIESLLLQFQNTNVKTLAYFDELVDKIVAENGLVTCSEMLNKTISIRTIQRYFKEVIGVSPKLFCQILRHKYILKLLYKNPEMKWCDMQLNSFYYDFAHFTKDFTRFSGLTPKKFLPQRNILAAALLESE